MTPNYFGLFDNVLCVDECNTVTVVYVKAEVQGGRWMTNMK